MNICISSSGQVLIDSYPLKAGAALASKGCLMARVYGKLAEEILVWGALNVLDANLDPVEGREKEPHVTAFYGFNTDFDPERLNQVIASVGPVRMVLGTVTRFECADYDVLKIDIQSPDLMQLNKAIAAAFPDAITPSEHEYRPHLTIAYVQKGTNKEVDKDETFLGRTITVKTLMYSLPDKKGRKFLPLGGSKDGNQNPVLSHRFFGLNNEITASTADEVDSIVEALRTTGKLPPNLPANLVEEMNKSLTRYFGKISADKIDQFTDRAKDIIQQTLQTMEEKRGENAVAEVGKNPATARNALSDFLAEQTATDAGSFMNMGFFLRIAREVVQGAMQHVARNWDQTRVDEYPALELYRDFERDVPRGTEIVKGVPNVENGWDYRWPAACDDAGDTDAAEIFENTGRMAALKSSDVWQSLGDGAGGYDDTLGNPFEPFAFNSGMGCKEVSRKDSEELGLIDKDEEAEPTPVDFSTLFDIDAQSGVTGGLNAGAPIGNQNARKHFGTNTPEFKDWFGKSAVVDENGEPLVVYKAMHPYDTTKEDKIPWNEREKQKEEGTFVHGPLIESIDRKEEFPAFNHGEPGVKIAGFFGDKDTANRFTYVSSVSAIYPCFLSIQKPFIMDAKGAPAGKMQFEETGRAFRDAIRSGKYDGVIIRNTKDEGTVYVALKPTQIKSAIGNSGKWDRNDPRLTARSSIQAENAGHPFHENQWTNDFDPPGKPSGRIKHAVLVVNGRRFRDNSHIMAAFKAAAEMPDVDLEKANLKEGFETESGHFLDRDQTGEYVGSKGPMSSEVALLHIKAVNGKAYTLEALEGRSL